VGRVEQRVEVPERPVGPVDVGEVGDVVAEVGQRRRVDGREPRRVGTELGEVVETRLDAREISDAVAVGVLERARVDLIDDRVAPPGRGRPTVPCRAQRRFSP
jgi:hypothetical protein